MDLASITGYAVGVVGLRYADFGEMRPKLYWAVVNAYIKAENDRLIFIADNIRRFAVTVANIFCKKKLRKLSEVWKMPWDDEGIRINISEADRKKQVTNLMQHYQNG